MSVLVLALAVCLLLPAVLPMLLVVLLIGYTMDPEQRAKRTEPSRNG